MHLSPSIHKSSKILKLSLEIPEAEYERMGHIRLQPRNLEAAVQRAVSLLDANYDQAIGALLQENSANMNLLWIRAKSNYLRFRFVNF